MVQLYQHLTLIPIEFYNILSILNLLTQKLKKLFFSIREFKKILIFTHNNINSFTHKILFKYIVIYQSILMNNTSNILINNYVTCIVNEKIINNDNKISYNSNNSYITYYLDTDFIDDYDNEFKIGNESMNNKNYVNYYLLVKKLLILSLFCVIIFIIYESVVSV